MSKQALVLRLAVVLAVGLASCGSSGGGSDGAPPDPVKTTREASESTERSPEPTAQDSTTTTVPTVSPPAGIVVCQNGSDGAHAPIASVDPDSGQVTDWLLMGVTDADISFGLSCSTDKIDVDQQGTVADPWVTRAAFSSDWRYLATSRTSIKYNGSHAGVIDLVTGEFTDLSGQPEDTSDEFATNTFADGPPTFDGAGNVLWHRVDGNVRTTMRNNGVSPGSPVAIITDGNSADGRRPVWTDPTSESDLVAAYPFRLSPDGTKALLGFPNATIVCDVTGPVLGEEDVFDDNAESGFTDQCVGGPDVGSGGTAWIDDTTVLGNNMAVFALSDAGVTDSGQSLVVASDRSAKALQAAPDRASFALEVDGGLWILRPTSAGHPEKLLERLAGTVIDWNS